ncbi:DUF4430 domain-containing protein [Patescibacteria group bacterium]|nr:DUF4430 domain-containing protein [Patescibacteria group bacterium]
MRKNTIWQTVGVGAVAIILLFGISATIDRNNVPSEPRQKISETQTSTVTIEGLYIDKDIQFISPKTVLEVLQQLDTEDDEVRLTTKDYPGLGTLVESIGDKTNGMDDKYWQYKVNGTMPQVGADTLEVKNGDTIEWYFSKSEF